MSTELTPWEQRQLRLARLAQLEEQLEEQVTRIASFRAAII